MLIELLRVQDLRCIESVELSLSAGLNVLVGPNGSGKTSILEAAHVLSYGRSFRSGPRDSLVRRGCDDFSVFARVSSGESDRRLGFERGRSGWRARVNEVEVKQIGQLLGECRVLCFEPGSHELISGPGEVRRRLLDWLLFHVEHGFVDVWRRYERALSQRNRLLRDRAPPSEVSRWDEVLADAGEALNALRASASMALDHRFRSVVSHLIPELGEGALCYRRGWSEEHSGLLQALQTSVARDRDLGYTVSGPHRGDLGFRFATDMGRHHLSRGQEKITALSLLLAMSDYMSEQPIGKAVLCMDDLFSELDDAHARVAIEALLARRVQVLLTCVQCPDWIQGLAPDTRLFHVEHGTIRSE